MSLIIAIDGPAASGKSSVARETAARLGFLYVNSGAMYRALTWLACEKGVSLDDENALLQLLRQFPFAFDIADGHLTLRVDGVDPTPFLNRDEINQGVSAVARHPQVRAILVDQQRNFGGEHDLVMEGRDIGSVVFPGTPYKFYIEASPEIRAHRRAAQGFKDAITERDQVDSSRAASPLRQADDAVVIDSTSLNLQEVVEKLISELPRLGFPADRLPQQTHARP